MNVRNLAFPLAAGFAILAPSATHAALVSLWDLDDTSGGVAVDSVGGNNATWQNGTNTNLANATGQIGGAADLSDVGAANNYFQMTIPQLIGASQISISLWMNNDANSGYTGIFMTRTFNGATNNSWGIAIEPDTTNWHFDSRVNGPGIDSAFGTTPVDGNWSHLVLVWDGIAGTHTQFINGAQTNTAASILGPIAGPVSGPWFIGYDDCCGGGRDFDGRIDDIAVWTDALNAAAVADIYNRGLNGLSAPEPGSSMLAFFSLATVLLRRNRR